MSLKAPIKELRQALGSQDKVASLPLIQAIDWKSWNSEVRFGRLNWRSPLSFCYSLDPQSLDSAGQDKFEKIAFAKWALPRMAKAGCNILLDAYEGHFIGEQPELAAVYVKAQLEFGYMDGVEGTPLHWAAGQALLPGNLVHRCLKAGSDANACDTSGTTPLHRLWWGVMTMAQKMQLPDDFPTRLQRSLEALLLAGADPDCVNENGVNGWDAMEEALTAQPLIHKASYYRELTRSLRAQFKAQQLESLTPNASARARGMRL